MRRIEQVPPVRHGSTGAPKIDGQWWQRVSTRAKALDDQTALIGWKAKMAAKGIATADDLRARAATTPLEDRAWRDIVERACDRAGASQGADLGTSIHAAAEMLELGDPEYRSLPADLRADADAFLTAMTAVGMTSLVGEMFVASQRFEVAGSFDRLAAAGDSAYIVDIKTINAAKRDPFDYAVRYSATAWACQTAMYASSLPYDGAAGFQDWEVHGLPAPSQRWAYIAMIPRGSGICRFARVDLAVGMELADVAYAVVKARKLHPVEVVA